MPASVSETAVHPARGAPPPVSRPGVVSRIRKSFTDHWILYLFLLPAFILVLLFRYLPIYGMQIAFKDYNIFRGLAESPWVGKLVDGQRHLTVCRANVVGVEEERATVSCIIFSVDAELEAIGIGRGIPIVACRVVVR